MDGGDLSVRKGGEICALIRRALACCAGALILASCGGGGGGGGGTFVPISAVSSQSSQSSSSTPTAPSNTQQVDAPSPPEGLYYANPTVIYTAGAAIAPNVPIQSGGAITRYTIEPSLPAGLQLDAGSGVISGTPQSVSASTLHTVTGSNVDGSIATAVRIEVSRVTLPPKNLHYTNEAPTYWFGQAIVANRPTAEGGAVTGFSVTPALPLGIQLDPVTGVVSGTPLALSPSTNYTVTSSNNVGSTGVVLRIAVGTANPAPTSLAYRESNAVYGVSQAISPNLPVNTGGAITRFIVVPSLPPGLSLNETTGAIVGTPAAAQSQAGYRITGSNDSGSAFTVVYITIVTGGSIQPTGTTNVRRSAFAGVLLPNGNVLVAGGYSAAATSPFDPPIGSAELYDAGTGKWTFTGSMNSVRAFASATALANGKVLVAGGMDTEAITGRTLNTAELFDPATGVWTATGSMSSSRSSHSATLLADGRVLVAGGYASGGGLNSAEIYDPTTGLWAPTSALNIKRSFHSADRLPNGKVLLAGGFTSSETATAELYDPATGAWTMTGSMNGPRGAHTSTLLLDGRVLVTGGSLNLGGLATSELYDPATGQWHPTGSLRESRFFHSATLLTNGKVIVAGGTRDASISGDLTSIEIYDPLTGQWLPDIPMQKPVRGHIAFRLLNASVLIAGGGNVTGDPPSALLYVPLP